MDKTLLEEKCRLVKVIPVLVIERAEDAPCIGAELLKGGFSVLEVTLRTQQAWDAAVTLMKTFPEASVGVGSVTCVKDLEKAHELGLHFTVSPGFTLNLLRRARQLGLPFLPGVATASEALMAYEEGYDFLKFFPAEINGGIKALQAIGQPLKNLTFCPTGGVRLENARDYLSLDNVACVGGTWMVSMAAHKSREWQLVRDEVVKTRALVESL